MAEPIPSPYANMRGKPETMLDELKVIFNKHGYKQFFVGCSKQLEGEQEWFGASNTISEGMLDYMKQNIQFLEDKLSENDDREA